MYWPRDALGLEEEEEDKIGLLNDQVEQQKDEGTPRSHIWSRVFAHRYDPLRGDDLSSADTASGPRNPAMELTMTTIPDDELQEMEAELEELQKVRAPEFDTRAMLRTAVSVADHEHETDPGFDPWSVGWSSTSSLRHPATLHQPSSTQQSLSSPASAPQAIGPLTTVDADEVLARRLQQEWADEEAIRAQQDEEYARQLQKSLLVENERPSMQNPRERETQQFVLAAQHRGPLACSEAPAVLAKSRAVDSRRQQEEEDAALARWLQEELRLQEMAALDTRQEDEELARRLQAELDQRTEGNPSPTAAVVLQSARPLSQELHAHLDGTSADRWNAANSGNSLTAAPVYHWYNAPSMLPSSQPPPSAVNQFSYASPSQPIQGTHTTAPQVRLRY